MKIQLSNEELRRALEHWLNSQSLIYKVEVTSVEKCTEAPGAVLHVIVCTKDRGQEGEGEK